MPMSTTPVAWRRAADPRLRARQGGEPDQARGAPAPAPAARSTREAAWAACFQRQGCAWSGSGGVRTGAVDPDQDLDPGQAPAPPAGPLPAMDAAAAPGAPGAQGPGSKGGEGTAASAYPDWKAAAQPPSASERAAAGAPDGGERAARSPATGAAVPSCGCGGLPPCRGSCCHWAGGSSACRRGLCKRACSARGERNLSQETRQRSRVCRSMLAPGQPSPRQGPSAGPRSDPAAVASPRAHKRQPRPCKARLARLLTPHRARPRPQRATLCRCPRRRRRLRARQRRSSPRRSPLARRRERVPPGQLERRRQPAQLRPRRPAQAPRARARAPSSRRQPKC